MIRLPLARMLRDGENKHEQKFCRDGGREKRSACVMSVELKAWSVMGAQTGTGQYGEKVDQKSAEYVPGREGSRRVQESSSAVDSMKNVINRTALLQIRCHQNTKWFTESVGYGPP